MSTLIFQLVFIVTLTFGAIANSSSRCAELLGKQITVSEHFKYFQVESDIIPAIYREQERFKELSMDPAHGTQTSTKAQIEAFVGLEAERLSYVKAPILRGPPEIEFFDGDGHPWDVKSPATDENWKFEPAVVAASIAKKMRQVILNSKTGEVENIRILLNVNWISFADYQILWRYLYLELTPEELSKMTVMGAPQLEVGEHRPPF